MVSKLKFLLIGMCIAVSFSACYTTKITVGDISPYEPMVKVNSQWNSHLIGGLISLGDTRMSAVDYVGNRPRYMIKTNQSFLNGLLSFITASIYTPTTTTYYVPVDELNSDYRNERQPSESRNFYSRARVEEPATVNNEPAEKPVQRVAPQPESRKTESAPAEQSARKTPLRSEPISETRESPAEVKATTRVEPSAPVVTKVAPQSDTYKATVLFKDGARMDGTIHPTDNDNKIKLVLPSGLVIESNVSEIDRILKK